MTPNDIPTLDQGPLFLRLAFNALRAYALSITPLSSETCDVVDVPGGKMILARGGGSASAPDPESNGYIAGFKVVHDPIPAQPYRVRVHFGGVNSLPPDGMTYGDAFPYWLDTGGSTGVVVLGVQINEEGQLPDTEGSRWCEISSTMPEDTDDIFYVMLGSYGMDDNGTFFVTTNGAGIGDQSFEACGGIGGVGNWGPV